MVYNICTKPENRDKRLAELKELLLAREYPESLIDRAVERAKKIPRKVALYKVTKKITEERPIFALKFDPRMPSVPKLLAKHWRSMVSQNQYMKECFKKPPMTTFRKQPNLRNLLIKSKIPPPPEPYPRRERKGM